MEASLHLEISWNFIWDLLTGAVSEDRYDNHQDHQGQELLEVS